jgi:hypothetical protein
MAEAKVKVGKKTAKGKTPENKIGKGTKPQAKEGAEGQYQYVSWVTCPYCWAVNEVVIDTNRWLSYYCWNCPGVFDV